MTAVNESTDLVTRRGAVFALVAGLLASESESIAASPELTSLRTLLEELDETVAAEALASITDADLPGHTWSALFEQGRVPPYEMSYLRPGLGGHTARMADVSGFYRAFGFRVAHDRPDHVVAELEFAALVTLGEADARERGDEEGAGIFADAAASFLRDHLGGWLDLLAERIDARDAHGPYGPLVRCAALHVERECERRDVVPNRIERIDVNPFAPAVEDQDRLPQCGSCPAFDATIPGP